MSNFENTLKGSANDTPDSMIQNSHPSESDLSENQVLPIQATANEAEFHRLCNKLWKRRRMIGSTRLDLKSIKSRKLRFWHSLAFVLKSDERRCVGVSWFVNKQGQNQIYIASNEPMRPSQQQEVTEIINMFRDFKLFGEIMDKVLPRHLPFITKQVYHMSRQRDTFSKEVPKLAHLSEELDNLFPLGKNPPLKGIQSVLALIYENKEELQKIDDWHNNNVSEGTRKAASRMIKCIRLLEDVLRVSNNMKRFEKDSLLQSLPRTYQFISFNCHPELAILKIAQECCISHKVYIGVSKRPCYCCDLLFDAIEENKSIDFIISMVPSNCKLYRGWTKIEGCFENEFNQVWEKVIKSMRDMGFE